MDGDEEEGPARLIIDLAAKIYAAHIHAGQAYVSLEQALACAATVVGAAQSAVAIRMVDRAKADPIAALARIEQAQATFSDAVDVSRRRQMADLAEALKSGGSH